MRFYSPLIEHRTTSNMQAYQEYCRLPRGLLSETPYPTTTIRANETWQEYQARSNPQSIGKTGKATQERLELSGDSGKTGVRPKRNKSRKR